MMKFSHFLVLMSPLFLGSCASSVEQMQTLLEKHPEIVTNSIEKNPDKYLAAFQKARGKGKGNSNVSETDRIESEFSNPLQPEIDPNRPVMGDPHAPILIVEYTDFQCPFCAQGYQSLEEV